MELKLYITINQIPKEYFNGRYENTEDFILEKVMEIVDGLEGNLYDLEIK